MREILFRGKSNYGNAGEWEYGLVSQPHVTEDGIVTSYYFTKLCEDGYSSHRTVSANTIGQYTGLTDKNGKKIFEGDIVNVNTNKDTLCHRYEGRNLVIRFDEYHRFVASGKLEYPLCNHYEWEVIGNIHDNPELLKQSQ
jgi:uncharacterized phage protein (TIGR01671 family)